MRRGRVRMGRGVLVGSGIGGFLHIERLGVGMLRGLGGKWGGLGRYIWRGFILGRCFGVLHIVHMKKGKFRIFSFGLSDFPPDESLL